MFIAFLIFLSGNFFEYRILSEMFEEKLISHSKKNKIGTIFVIFKIFSCFFLKKSLVLAWIVLMLPAFSLKIASFQIKIIREKSFETHFLEFLNLFLLYLKSGKSFSVSFQLSVQSTNENHRQKLNELYNFVFFADRYTSRDQNVFLNSVITDLSRAVKAPQNASRLVASLRDRLKTQKILRERARVMTQSARTQAFFLLPLYFGLIVFSAVNFGFRNNIRIFLLSNLLFCLGILWLLQIGRSFRWRT
jgi:Flp pilus assembly protein TadB